MPMNYRVPVAEQMFLLDTIAEVREMAGSDTFPNFDVELILPVLTAAANLAEGSYSPLSRNGDRVGARWEDGSVTMPPGYRAAYQAYVEGGWGSLNASSRQGGQGLPFVLATAVQEGLGTADLAFALVHMLTQGAAAALLAHGSESQKGAWLEHLLTGSWPGTMNLTEPQAGSDLGAIATMATPDSRGTYSRRGQKIFISYGEHDLADNILHLVLARTPDAAPGSKGISLFMVPKLLPDERGHPTIDNGVRCLSIEHKLGMHASPTCVMSFGEEAASSGELVGSLGGGMRAMFTMMNHGRLNVGNQGVQVAERATQLASEYARARVQSSAADGSSGRSPVAIARHPDVRRMLVRMGALTQAARALVYYAASQVDVSEGGNMDAQARLELLTPLAKSYATDIGCEVASLGLQVHGGPGFTEDAEAAQHYRDARILPIYEGTNGIQAADFVNRKLLGDRRATFDRLLDDIEAGAEGYLSLGNLAAEVRSIADWMETASVNDRLSGSYPLMTMTAGLVAAWLYVRQLRTLSTSSHEVVDPAFRQQKEVHLRHFVACIVPEVSGLAASAIVGADALGSFD